jgi:peptidyl-prolyl cis-trans isomerase SurA
LKIKFILASLTSLFTFSITSAQPIGILDEIIAVVGENYILRSDLEAEYFQIKTQYEVVPENLRCELMEQLLMQQLMLHKADVDSTYVGEDVIEAELERRLRFYASQIGGEKKLEKYLGKSIAEYKETIRPTLEKQMRIQEVQTAMIKDIKVSPTEVRSFFDEIPKDSLPVFESEVEVGQILITPKPSKFAKEYAYSTLEKLRNEIISGKRDFGVTASSYSDDVGSKMKGGELGYFERGQMVPEFEAMAYKLKGDSISAIIETDFGYHILQLMDRKGERLNVRHILIKPKIIETDIDDTKDFLRQLTTKIKADSISFCDAAAKFSEDENTKGSCGLFTNAALGTNKVELNELEADVALVVQRLDPGQISSPIEVHNPDGTSSYRIIYLKSEVEPHLADLKTDYQKIQAYATEKKKAEEMQKWAQLYRKSSYVWIDEDFTDCPTLKEWNNNPK